MIGFYNYTVILTYMSAICAVFGMTQAAQGKIKIALYCLMACGMFDLFDGKVARTKKDRTDHEKVFPAMINYHICDSYSSTRFLGLISSSMLVVGAVIRLGYFNVMEQERQQQTDENRVSYQGLPVTSDAAIIPFAYLMKQIACRKMDTPIFNIAFCIIIIIIAILFVMDIDIKKPNGKGIVALGIMAVTIIFGLMMV